MKTYVKIIFAVAIFAALYWAAQSSFVAIMDSRNGEFLVEKYKVKEESFFHPRLKLLRKRETLDKVISSGSTQFEKIVLLRKWTRHQWEPSDKFYYPPWDAVEILDLARKHNNRGFCAQYAIVFAQACLSLGIHARYVDLPGHFVCSIWSDDYDKWVLMDELNDIHFERNGNPLSVRELCMAYWKNDISGIFRVDSNWNKTQIKRDDIRVYRMYSIILRTNHLSKPIEISYNGVLKKLMLTGDYHNYPLMSRDSLSIYDNQLAYREKFATEFFTDREYSDDPDDFRHDENQTIIYFAGSKNDKTKVKII